MAEGRDTKGTVGADSSKIPWWQKGSTQKKPTYFIKNAFQRAVKADAPRERRRKEYYAEQSALNEERNKFYSQYGDMKQAPKYTFAESLSLYNKGYAGVFGRSKTGQTISLLGQPWQQAYALDALRRGKDLMEYNVVNTRPGTTDDEDPYYKELAAADRSGKTWTGVMDLYKGYEKIGGEEGYKRRFGKGDIPGEGSKYALLYNMDNKSAKQDDIQATYQSNLSKMLAQAAKQDAKMAGAVDNPEVANVLTMSSGIYAALAEKGKINANEKREKPNKDDIKAMEEALAGRQARFSKEVEAAIGAASPNRSKIALSTALAISGGPMYGQILSSLAQSDQGQKVANNFLGRMERFSADPSLAKEDVDWSSYYGIPGIGRAAVTGLARFGIGFVPGSIMAVDEGLIALNESKKAPKQAIAGLIGTGFATGTLGIMDQDKTTNRILKTIGTDDTEWGKDIDFELGDALWSDFAERYYDPFAYGKGKDGKEEFQGFWRGLRQPEDWKDFGNSVASDPVAYALDLLDVFPVVGVAAKAVSAGGVLSKTGRFGKLKFKMTGEVAKAEAARAGVLQEFEDVSSVVRDRGDQVDVDFADMTADEKAAWLEADNQWVDDARAEYNRQRKEIIESDEYARQRQEALDWVEANDGKLEGRPRTILDDFEAQHMNGQVNVRPRPKFSQFAGVRVLRDRATNILEAVRKDPDVLELLDEQQIFDAAKTIDEMNKVDDARRAVDEAEAAVLEARRRLEQIPSVRTFRRVARQALAGVPAARRQLDQWRAFGYEFNGAENLRSLRFSAAFESRTRVLEPTDPNITYSPLAVVKMPANPLARGIKNSMYWVGQYIVDPTMQKVNAAAQMTGSQSLGRLTAKMVDLPLAGYRWNYTNAVKNALQDSWGDQASEMRFAANIYRLQDNADFSPETSAAILSEIYGGDGPIAKDAPMLRRQAILDKLDSISEDGKFMLDNDYNIQSTFVRGTEDQAEALLRKYRELLDTEIKNIDEAAAAFDDRYVSRQSDIRKRLLDADFKADDIELGLAVEVYRNMIELQEKISHRIVHTDTNPFNIEYLRNLYMEPMNALRITPEHLFGKDGRSGRLGDYVDNVVLLNNAIQPLLENLIDMTDNNIIGFAQKADAEGTVFDNLDNAVGEAMEQEWLRFVRTLTGDGDGLFRRGDAGPNDTAAPVIIRAGNQQGVPKGFTRVHLPRIKTMVADGKVATEQLVNPRQSFVIPNEFLITRKTSKGKGRTVRTLTPEEGRKALETGSLNAMSDIFPNARYYSEKVSESGFTGARDNEKQVKNEHVVATSGLREHSIAMAVKSEIMNYQFRMTDQLVRQAEEQAILLPAEQVVGKPGMDSGYRALAIVRPFDDIESARAFAVARGVEKQFDEALEAGPQTINSITEANPGLSVMDINGEQRFVVRGSVDDWAKYSGDEDLATNSIMSDYKNRAYETEDALPTRGYVFAVPNIVDEKLSMMVIQGNTYATRLLEKGLVKSPTSLFKRIVLNFRLGFIQANVVGGTGMLMMRNPNAASKILARAIAKNARLSGDSAVAKWAGDSAAVDRHLSMEYDQNAYSQDGGVASRVKEPQSITDLRNGGSREWLKKYIWNGGYTTVAAFERMVRNAVAVDFLTSDPTFKTFMQGPEVQRYIDNGVDYYGTPRAADGADAISPFEAAADLLLDRASPFFDAELKYRMRYNTNTVSGNYHRFAGWEQLMRNAVMPFYAWQRHSLAYTWRMAVDKPITANALYHIGQAGYNQVAEQGLPDYLRQTIPLPEVIKAQLDMIPEDFRIDGSNLNPFGATTELTTALYRLITGDTLGGKAESIFKFANPYLNNMIEDTLGVNPVNGNINWSRINDDSNGKGILGSTLDTAGNIGKSTYFGSVLKAKDVVDNAYEADALSNMYPAIESAEEAEEILANMYTTDAEGNPVSKGLTGWSLKIPKPRTVDQKNRAVDLFGAMGFKSYVTNAEVLADQSRDEFVSAMALSYYNNKKLADQATSEIGRLRTWEQNRRFVEDYWLPRARKFGVDEGIIQVALMKLRSQKPKNFSSIDPNLLNMTMGG